MADVVYGRHPGPGGAARAAPRAGGRDQRARRRRRRGWPTRACRRASPRARSSTRWPAAPTTRASSARVDPYPYADADELVAGERPLRAGPRRHHRPAEPGRDRPGRRVRRRRRPGACRGIAPRTSRRPSAARRQAPSSTCRSRSCPTSRTGCSRSAAPACGRTRPTPTRASTYTAADLADGAVLVIGAEGKGVRPRVREACDAVVGIPLQGRIGSLNAGTAAAILHSRPRASARR